MDRKLRMGMVGGSYDAFIGAIHRNAALMDGEIELVCGAFSSSPERSAQTGRKLYLPVNRVYSSFEEMIEKEKALDPSVRMDLVSIVTPNYLHFPQAKLALENGFHVICDKPMTAGIEEAEELARLAEASSLEFVLTHNYTGYPMVKQAREMILSGSLGKVRKVVAEYSQGWLSSLIEKDNDIWRADPKRSGGSLTLGDIGSHVENLTEYICGLSAEKIQADIRPLLEGRKMDDDININIDFGDNTKGAFIISQASTGEENNLKIKIYTERAGVEWSQMEPNSLYVRWADRAMEIMRAGNNREELCDAARDACRLPAGHPEGFIEAFANIYRNFARAVRRNMEGKPMKRREKDLPDHIDGLRGMRFIDAVITSGKDENWYEL